MPATTPGNFKPHHQYQRKYKSSKLQLIKKSENYVPIYGNFVAIPILQLSNIGYETATWKHFKITFVDECTEKNEIIKCLSHQTIRDVYKHQIGIVFYIVCNGIIFKVDIDVPIRSLRILPKMRDIKNFVIYYSQYNTFQNELKCVQFTHNLRICSTCKEKINCEWNKCVGCALFGQNSKDASAILKKSNDSYLCLIYEIHNARLIKCMASFNHHNTLLETCDCYKLDFIENNGILYALETGKTMKCLVLGEQIHVDDKVSSFNSFELKQIQRFAKSTPKIIPLKPEKGISTCNIL
jgi:hypothetical protein